MFCRLAVIRVAVTGRGSQPHLETPLVFILACQLA